MSAKLVTAAVLCIAGANWPAYSAQWTQENAFVRRASTVLQARYPTAAVASNSGYVKMRDLDKDKTVIYTNFSYSRATLQRPNFLWFARDGKLVGVDYQFPTSTWTTPPIREFPVPKARWVVISEHVHFAYVLAGKTVRHGGPALPNLRHEPITLAALQADKLVPKGARLLWATYHPACWDLGFWTVPNPDGPFAGHNTRVR